MLLRSSTKRSASDLLLESAEHCTLTAPAGQRSSSHKKIMKAVPPQQSKPQTAIQPGFPLLRLPFELRNQILHEILISPSGCLRRLHERENNGFRGLGSWGIPRQNLDTQKSKKDNNNDTVCPAVLRTCKQLRDEGLPILYSNTFSMDLYIHDGFYGLYFQGYDLSTGHGLSPDFLVYRGWNVIPYPAREQLLQYMRRLHITIHVEENRDPDMGPLEFRDSSDYRLIVSRLSERLLEIPNLASLELLSVAVQNKHPFHEGNDIGEHFLKPLTLLRNLRCVTITGVSPAYAQSMKCVMESQVPVQNLCAMRISLAVYLGEKYYDEEGWDDIDEAVSTCDTDMFCEYRAEIVTRFDEEKRRKLYSFG